MKRQILPGLSVDYSGNSHLAVATERYVKFNNKYMYTFLMAIVLFIIM